MNKPLAALILTIVSLIAWANSLPILAILAIIAIAGLNWATLVDAFWLVKATLGL